MEVVFIFRRLFLEFWNIFLIFFLHRMSHLFCETKYLYIIIYIFQVSRESSIEVVVTSVSIMSARFYTAMLSLVLKWKRILESQVIRPLAC